MIEFKASCGHTVRAKDEDAGRRVRCSYCGRVATVPDESDSSLDFLLEDTDDAGSTDGEHKPTRRRRWFSGRGTGRRQPLDPVATIFRMCYAAALLIIVIVVVRKFVIPLFREDGLARRVATIARGSDEPTHGSADSSAPPTEGFASLGLIRSGDRNGLYVASTPSGATAYVLEASKAPAAGRIHQTQGCKTARAEGVFVSVPDGTYVVEVVLAWNYGELVDRRLPGYEDYQAFRRAIARATSEERTRLLEDYFVPDDADAVFVDESEDQIYLVRQYRHVKVCDGRSPGVRALFLPKIRPGGRDEFSLAPLVTDYIPPGKSYAFNELEVRADLDLYKVPEADRRYIIEALSRIGVIPYASADDRTRLFRIGIDDGMFVAKVVREATE